MGRSGAGRKRRLTESKLRGIIVSCINGNSDREDLCVLNGELAEWVEDG